MLKLAVSLCADGLLKSIMCWTKACYMLYLKAVGWHFCSCTGLEQVSLDWQFLCKFLFSPWACLLTLHPLQHCSVPARKICPCRGGRGNASSAGLQPRATESRTDSATLLGSSAWAFCRACPSAGKSFQPEPTVLHPRPVSSSSHCL